MTDRRRRLGQLGERLARKHLLRSGYTVLEANYRTRSGEIDLVTRLGDALVFVEVRTRTGRALGSPEESITERKRARLVAAAQEYMQITEATDAEWRIDVVAVQMDLRGTVRRLEVVENAVQL